MSIILGLDPGTRVTGFGLLRVGGPEKRGSGASRGPSAPLIPSMESISRIRSTETAQLISYGVISMSSEAPLSERLRELSTGLRSLLQKYQPHEVAIEKIFLGKNADSAFKLGHARGVLMAECALAGAEICEYGTRLVKKSLTGKGSASKEDVNRMVGVHLGVREIRPMDASDALALALHHLFQRDRPDFKKGFEVNL